MALGNSQPAPRLATGPSLPNIKSRLRNAQGVVQGADQGKIQASPSKPARSPLLKNIGGAPKPAKGSLPKLAGGMAKPAKPRKPKMKKQPTFADVQKSVAKSMGY